MKDELEETQDEMKDDTATTNASNK